MERITRITFEITDWEDDYFVYCEVETDDGIVPVDTMLHVLLLTSSQK